MHSKIFCLFFCFLQMQVVFSTETEKNTENDLISVVIAGGSGSRLFPISRDEHSKIFVNIDCLKMASLPLENEHENYGQTFSLIQNTYLNNIEHAKANRLITVTNQTLLEKVQEHYNQISGFKPLLLHDYIVEPIGRNTAPAIAAAVEYVLTHIVGDPILLISPADHIIGNKEEFQKAVEKAKEFAQQGHIVLFGAKPTHPETGYGYTEYEEYNVTGFKEKPDFETATAYVRSQKYLWNLGIFCGKASAFQKAFQTHAPKILEIISSSILYGKIQSNKRFSNVVYLDKYFFEKADNISIDYAIMEKSVKNLRVVPCDLEWRDMGCFKALSEILHADSDNNRTVGDSVLYNTMNSTVINTTTPHLSNQIVCAAGINNMIIVNTPDVLLVIHKDAAQDVKVIYNELKNRNHPSYKKHPFEEHECGTRYTLTHDQNVTVKRIYVNPLKKFSLTNEEGQKQNWTVAEGSALFSSDNWIITKSKGENIDISVPMNLSIENQSGIETVHLIQTIIHLDS